MGDSINVDFGQLQQPNFVGGMVQSYQAGRQMGMQERADNALAAVQANPNDPAALTNLAVYNPQAANAFLTMAQNQRLNAARAASAGVYRAFAAGQPGAVTTGTPALTAPAPAQASPAPALASSQPSPAPSGTTAAPTAPASPQQPQGVPVAQLLTPNHPVTQQVGAAVTSGQMSMADAIANLATYADPSEVQAVIANINGMDGLRKSKLQEANGALATAAQSVLSIPDDPTHSARRAAAMAMAPQLAAHGVTTDQIQNADLSDAGLHGLIGSAIGVEGLIKQSNEDRTFAETHRHNVADENKPVSVAFGNSLVRPDGTVVSDGMGGTGSSQPSYASVPFAQVKQQIINHEAPQAVGGYNAVAFNTPGGGNAAGLKPVNLTGMTIGQVLDYQKNVIRPATAGQRGTGDPGSTGVGAYQFESGTLAQQAQAAFGKNWKNVPFTPENQDKIAETLYNSIRNDRGALSNTWSVFAPQAAPSGGMQGAIEAQAQQIASYNMPPPTGRAMTSAQGMAIMQRVSQLNPDYDATKYHEKNVGATAFGSGKLGSQVRSLNVAVDHLDLLGQAATALQNHDVQAFNSIGNSIAQATGSAAPTNFNALKQFVMDETVKAIVGGGGGVGDRDKASEIISPAQSPAQLAGAVHQVQGLMGGQLQGLKRQYEAVTGNTDFEQKVSPRAAQVLGMHGQTNAAPVRVNSPQEAAALPSGALFQTPDGRVIRKH